jgi:hypothetical protein
VFNSLLPSRRVRSALAAGPGTGRKRDSRRALRASTRLDVQSLEPRFAMAVGVADANLTAPADADLTAPAVKSISAPAARNYTEGSVLQFRVNFTERVFVTGTPTLPVTIGDTVRDAVWNGKGGNGTRSLVFETVVQSGDAAPAGVQVEGELSIGEGASIRDKAGNDVAPRVSQSFKRVKVDAAAPAVAEFRQIVKSDEVVVLANFTEPVMVRGKPYIPFTLAGEARQLDYVSGSGTDVLVFRYRANNGEVPTAENVVAPAPAIVLGTGRIFDAARNQAGSLTEPVAPPPQLEQRKGLFASDSLRVDRTTGEMLGDEPVLLTIAGGVTTATDTSRWTSLYPSLPAELGSNIRTGRTVHIPDAAGDIWFNDVKPLGVSDILAAWIGDKAIQIPIQFSVQLAFEGDLSNKYVLGTLGVALKQIISDNILSELQKISVRPREFLKFSDEFAPYVDKPQAKQVFNEILAKLRDAAMPSTDQLMLLGATKLLDFFSSGGDPDDLVGVSMTMMVPVTDTMRSLLGSPDTVKLLGNWTNVYRSPDRTVVPALSWSGEPEVRYGLLVGGEQRWDTTIEGRTRGAAFADNAWATYVVGTKAWREINW